MHGYTYNSNHSVITLVVFKWTLLDGSKYLYSSSSAHLVTDSIQIFPNAPCSTLVNYKAYTFT